MRLLKRKSHDSLELVTFSDDIPPYAILSHTWGDGEVTYDELIAGTGTGKAGYAKIRFTVDKAAEDGLEYSWVDTCCINKSTSDELSTAINSMFRWYERAAKCYVFLSDVHVPEEVTDAQAFPITWIQAFRRSRWFTRGWTLQELIAPAAVEFYSQDCKKLGSKISLEKEIFNITRVPITVLRGQNLAELSIDERKGWAEKRTTTLPEDKAYCLLGIFGVFLPLIYGEGEAHAFLRLEREFLSTNNAQILQKASSNVPFRKDDDFVDRGDILARIEERCSRPAGRAALVGVGGFGKSQLAIEYAHRVRQQKPNTWVFWMHAGNSARLKEAFNLIAEMVGVSSQSGATADSVPTVLKWLSNNANGRWLMILDNVDEEVTIEYQNGGQNTSLASLLPQSDHGAILVTSRNTDIARNLVGREQDIIRVGTMSEGEAAQLLQNKLGGQPQEDAGRLVNALDCIPLAIIQAAAYINRLGPRMSVTKYVQELGRAAKQAQLLKKPAPDTRRDREASNSVLTTWEISFKHIRDKRQSAADLLSFMSFFNRQGIPEFMVRHYTDFYTHKNSDDEDKDLSTPLGEDDIDFEEDVAMLHSFSLIETTERTDEFEMHGLVQLATKTWLKSIDTERRWHQTVTQAMAREFPELSYETWSKCRALFPHVLSLIEGPTLEIREDNNLAELLFSASWYARQQYLLVEAESMVSTALNIRKKTLGDDHPDVFLTIGVLGSIRTRLGEAEDAETMLKQAMTRSEEVLGIEHHSTLRCRNYVTEALHAQSKYDEAETMSRRTLAICERVLGIRHYITLMCESGLAWALYCQDKYEEAESRYRHAVLMFEEEFGVDHPNTVRNVFCHARVLDCQDRYDEAIALFERAITGFTATFGGDHSATIDAQKCLEWITSRRERNSRDHLSQDETK